MKTLPLSEHQYDLREGSAVFLFQRQEDGEPERVKNSSPM
jgi:hypothetical protein